MHALYSPCTRRMGLQQRHIGMTGIIYSLVVPALISLTFPPPVSVCGGGRGRREGGITCWVAHFHARHQRERPNLCSYSYMRLNGSELVGC